MRSTDRVLAFLRVLGPGLIAGSADDDPSGIGTYAIAGASLGYATLWTAVFTIPMMIAVQFTCAKISIVTGRGLADTLRRHYSAWIVYPTLIALFGANTVNAGADLGAIGAGVELLVPVPRAVVVVVAAVLLVLLLLVGSYATIERTFKWLTLALLAYIGSAALAHPDWGAALLATVRPTLSLDEQYISTLVALFGTVISPYLFFWQSAEEVEEVKQQHGPHVRLARTLNKRLRTRAIDVGTGMALSNVVTYFVILATAATLHASGQTDVNSAADAARALQPLAGSAASLLCAVGLIGAGMLAVPVLTGSAAYAIAGARHWRSGLDQAFGRARGFYSVMIASTVIGAGMNFTGINPFRALFVSALLNGLLAPPLLALLLLLANRRSVMRRHTNGKLLNLVGWATTLVMALAALGAIVTSLA
jgi:NRAMP (natural resistance-associated macrophage protein)-like metal ion transporter